MRTIRSAILLLCLGLPAVAATVAIEPFSAFVTAGSSFDMIINVSGITDLYAFQFDMSFDPDVLHASSIDSGPFSMFFPGMINNTAGTITFVADSLLGPVPGFDGDVSLATVHFTAVARGSSPVKLANVILLDSSLHDIAYDLIESEITATPEPSTYALIGCGLFGLCVFKRHRKARCVSG